MDLDEWNNLTRDERHARCKDIAGKIAGCTFIGLGVEGLGCFEVASRRFVLIPSQSVQCGWRKAPLALTPEQRAFWVQKMPEWTNAESPEDLFGEQVTPPRIARLPMMLVEADGHPAEPLAEELLDGNDEANPLVLIAQHEVIPGFRVPTTDQWEALYRAGVTTVFPWGDEWPDGIPYGQETTFQRHRRRNEWGLQFNPDAYWTEIVAGGELRGGDGGGAICGGVPSPYAWHTFACAYLPMAELWDDLCIESLETAEYRLVHVVEG